MLSGLNIDSFLYNNAEQPYFCFVYFFYFFYFFYSLLTNVIARCPHSVFLSFFLFPAGHSVSYLEYMTHMAADHWQKRKGEQFLYKWYLKITKFEDDLRLECNRERGGGGEFSVGTFGLGSLTELYFRGNDDPLWAPLVEELQMLKLW